MTPVCIDIGKKISKKMKFSSSEDNQLIALVGNNYDTVNWDLVAFALGNRTARQCKDRYHAYLAPGLNKNEWTAEEDKQLLDLVSKHGQKWKMLAPSFNGRPEVSLKNRYRLLQRRISKKERQEKEKQALIENLKRSDEEKTVPIVSSPEEEDGDMFAESLGNDTFFYDDFGADDFTQPYF